MNCILYAVNLKLRIEKFEIKTKSVKTSKSVSEINSVSLTEKSKTSKLIQWKDFFLFFYCFTSGGGRSPSNLQKLVNKLFVAETATKFSFSIGI